MEARMNNPVMVLPEALDALHALARATAKAGLSETTLELVRLRASQINGCSVCSDMHAKAALKAGDTVERVVAVGAWRETPWFTDAERAALALTESMSRLADRPEAVSDEVWSDAADSFDEPELAALVLEIAHINLWNRVNAATRQVAGAW